MTTPTEAPPLARKRPVRLPLRTRLTLAIPALFFGGVSLLALRGHLNGDIHLAAWHLGLASLAILISASMIFVAVSLRTIFDPTRLADHPASSARPRMLVVLALGVVIIGALLVLDALIDREPAPPPPMKVAGLSHDRLMSLRDQAIPLIEEVTGLRFSTVPKLDLTSLEGLRSRILEVRKIHPGVLLFSQYQLSGYFEDTSTIHIIPKNIVALCKRENILVEKARHVTEMALVHELVRALERQHDWGAEFSESHLAADHADFVIGRIAPKLQLDPHVLKIWMQNRNRRVLRWPIFCGNDLPRIERERADALRFVEEIYRAGGSDLAKEVLSDPPTLSACIATPKRFLLDRESGFLGRYRAALDRLESILGAEGWRAINPFREYLYPGDPLPGLGIYGLPHPDRDKHIMSHVGSFTTAEGTVAEVYGSDASVMGIYIFRFTTSGTAREYVATVRQQAQNKNAYWRRHGPDHEIKTTELGEDTVHFEHIRGGYSRPHSFHIFTQLKTFVLHLDSFGGTSDKDLKDLWGRVSSGTHAEFVEPRR